MRVVVIHNDYQQPGGETEAVRSETGMLTARGHAVREIPFANSSINTLSARLKAAWQAPYSAASGEKVGAELAAFRPDLVHVHNFFPLVTPSVYDACREAGVPVVQTLHNYRIICPGALLRRGDRTCEDCLRASAYRAVRHRCYRRSWLGTLAVARMVQHHRARSTWREKVGCFIALTEFAKEKFVEGGLPAGRISVKPNFTRPDPGEGQGGGGYALYAGRLSAEKGLAVLLKAWERLGWKFPLKIAGDGPLADRMRRWPFPGVHFLGFRSKEVVISLMKEADFLVLPSLWYEGLPMALIEAYATGLPAVGSRIGSLATLIRDGQTGLLFLPNDPGDLAAKVEWLRSHPEELAQMRKAARSEYLMKYTEQRNYELLMAIYERTIAEAAGPAKP